MKRALKIILFLCTTTVFAQEISETVYSVYFRTEAFAALKKANGVSTLYHGSYEPENTEENALRRSAGEYIKVDETGIYLEKNKLLFITREQVREDSKYQVRDGYIFGVIENDSLPTALEGENYYFLVPSKTYIYQTGSADSFLYDAFSSGVYFLAQPEDNGHFTVIVIHFSGSGIDMKELVLNDENCSVQKIKKCEIIKGDFNTYILSPVSKEWEQLATCFEVYDRYVKE